MSHFLMVEEHESSCWPPGSQSITSTYYTFQSPQLIISPSHFLLYPKLSPSHSLPNPVILNCVSHPLPHSANAFLNSLLSILCYSPLTDSPGHVQFTSSLCSGLLQVPLAVLSYLITKAIPCGGHVSFLYLQT